MDNVNTPLLSIIESAGEDPLGMMLLDYLHGDNEAHLMVESTTLEMSAMTGEYMFRDFGSMSALEQVALELSWGNTLDVGGGSGCHSLYLQQQKIPVCCLDISPGCVVVMQQRGVQRIYQQNIFTHQQGGYDTVLMLMNGIGMVGSLAGLDYFLSLLSRLLSRNGQLLGDSTDLTQLYHEAGSPVIDDGAYHGETQFVMRYNDIESQPFPWLYLKYDLLVEYARRHGLCCELLLAEDNGQYLFRLSCAS